MKLGINNFSIKWKSLKYEMKWNVEYCENKSRLCVFILRTNARSVGMSLPQTTCDKINSLRTDVEQFHSSMDIWALTPSLNCECSFSKQTTDHVPIACSKHWAPHEAQCLTVLENET